MPWRRRREPSLDEGFIEQANQRSTDDLSEARRMSQEAREVSARVRHQRELNHWAQTVREALGGVG